MKRMLLYSLPVILLLAGCATRGPMTMIRTGQYPKKFETEIRFTVSGRYLLYLPEQYAGSRQKWPLMLFLHGAGERGSDIELVKMHGPPKLVAHGKPFPFIIVSPQCPRGDFWNSEKQLIFLSNLLDDIVKNYRVDTDRIYLTGLSMGGFGTWSLAIKHPHKFAAIVPICGGGDPEQACQIKHLPVWVFHGAKDRTVPLKRSQEMVNALKECGGDVQFTIYPDAAHDAWTETYNNPKLYDWLLSHSRK